MSTVSNELKASAFISGPQILTTPRTYVPVQLSSTTSPVISFTVLKPAGTPAPRKAKALTILSIPRGTRIGDWHLKSVMLVQVRSSRRESLATVWLEGTAEYGTGRRDDSAIADLMVSLGEYREGLERREENLGDSARQELDCLQKLIERADQPNSPGT